MSKLNRRDFLRLGVGTTLAGSAFAGCLRRPQAAATGEPPVETVPAKAPPTAIRKMATSAPSKELLATRPLGQTGKRISIFGLGGASAKTPLSNGPHESAVAIVERALALGVTYFDTASSYGNGKSERAIGEVAAKHRARMTIASKTSERSYDGAMRELEASLKRLQTDHLDVWLMHHVSLTERDTQPAFGVNGAVKALEKAVAEKMVRFAGVSGHHSTEVLADWLRRHPFDVVLMPINAVDKHHSDSFIERVLPVARERKVGVVAMKIPAYGKLLRPNDGVGIREALAYTLSQPGLAGGIIACDSIEMLEQNVAAARDFTALDAKDLAALEAKTAFYWESASFYRDWT